MTNKPNIEDRDKWEEGYNEALKAENLMPAFQEKIRKARIEGRNKTIEELKSYAIDHCYPMEGDTHINADRFIEYLDSLLKEEGQEEAVDESMLCDKCGHFKEDHYWNGIGHFANSGYDSCHICGCSEYDWDTPIKY